MNKKTPKNILDIFIINEYLTAAGFLSQLYLFLPSYSGEWTFSQKEEKAHSFPKFFFKENQIIWITFS